MKYLTRYTQIVLVAVCIMLAGCDLLEQRDRTYQGPPQLEFFPLDRTANEGSGQVSVEVQLIGEQRGSPTNVVFSVLDAETDAAAEDYDIVTASPVTIPANSSQTNITIDLNGSGIPEGEFRTLTLQLEDGSDVEPAPNLRQFELTIQGQ